MTPAKVFKLFGSLIGAAGVACALTVVSLGMRSVLNVGGTCASGNSPYVIRQQCPTGVAWLLPVAIWAGLGFLLLFYLCAPQGGKRCAVLAWPGLFLSLGWNFLQYGLPIDGHSLQAGWLVPGILFILMGIVPLIFVAPGLLRALRGVPSEPAFSQTTGSRFRTVGTTVRAFTPGGPPTNLVPGPMFSAPVPPNPQPPRGPGGADVTSELERLAALHRSGDLTDSEYESAKRSVVFGSGS
jgi:hypothetical protein